MTTPALDQDDPLDDFERRDIRLLGSTHRVYVMGRGPAVVLMAEIPGINPYVTRCSASALSVACCRTVRRIPIAR